MILRQGDIVFVDFDPQAGHEQKGRRPALIVSGEAYHRHTRLAIACPITNTDRRYPLHVPLPSSRKTTGFVMCEQLRSLDPEARNAAFQERLPDPTLKEILDLLGLFFVG